MANSLNTADHLDSGRPSGRRGWARVLVWSLAAAAIAFVATWLATPEFRGQARLLVETKPAAGNEAVAGQVEIIGSTDILQQVAAALKLQDLPEFDDASHLTPFDHLLITAGLKTDPRDILPQERVLRHMRDRLDVYPVEKSNVIVIAFASQDRGLAAEIPNRIAERYLALAASARPDAGSHGTGTADTARMAEQVRAAEAKLSAFRARSDAVGGENRQLLATQQLSELTSELSRAGADRAAAEATAEAARAALRDDPKLDALPKIFETPLIRQLRDEAALLKADITELAKTLPDTHSRMRALKARLADLTSQIGEEANNVLKSLATEVNIARARQALLAGDLDRLKAQAASFRKEAAQLRALEQNVAAQRQALDAHLTRRAPAAGDSAYLPSEARILQLASTPVSPDFPNRPLISAAVFIGAFLMASLALRPRRRKKASAPSAAIVPPATPDMSTTAGGANDISDAPTTAGSRGARDAQHEKSLDLRVIDVQGATERAIADGVTRAIFVSPEGDEGAATSVLTARDVADAGLRVLLLDLSVSGAASSAMLEGRYFSGITNLLASEAQFSDVIHTDHYSECHVIPVGTGDPIRATRAVERLPLILDSLSTVYDLVVVECGPADSRAVGRLVTDETLVLVSAIDSADDRVADAAASLQDAGHEGLLLVSPRHKPLKSPAGRTAA